VLIALSLPYIAHPTRHGSCIVAFLKSSVLDEPPSSYFTAKLSSFPSYRAFEASLLRIHPNPKRHEIASPCQRDVESPSQRRVALHCFVNCEPWSVMISSEFPKRHKWRHSASIGENSTYPANLSIIINMNFDCFAMVSKFFWFDFMLWLQCRERLTVTDISLRVGYLYFDMWRGAATNVFPDVVA